MKEQKLILALQFWSRDKEQAMKVARLVADLQPNFCETADFLFVARFDCTQDEETIKYVSRKFNVQHFVNSCFRGSEWPHGCNSLWFGVQDYLFKMQEAKRIPDYKAVLTFEADSCPIHPAWIAELSRAWDLAHAKVVGHLLPNGPDGRGHINGNCMSSCDMDFLRWIARKVGGVSPHGGWDYLLAPQFRARGWADTPTIRSWYRTPSVDEATFNLIVSQGIALLHGVKDSSLIHHVRRRFLT